MATLGSSRTFPLLSLTVKSFKLFVRGSNMVPILSMGSESVILACKARAFSSDGLSRILIRNLFSRSSCLLTSEASAAALSAALACLAATSAVLAAISAALATLSAALPAAADASADIIPNATFNNTFGDVTCGTTGPSTSPHLLLPALLATPGTRSPATREEEQEEEEGVGPDSATFPPGALSRS